MATLCECIEKDDFEAFKAEFAKEKSNVPNNSSLSAADYVNLRSGPRWVEVQSVLGYACAFGRTNVVKYLLQDELVSYKRCIEAEDDLPPLLAAVRCEKLEVVKYLFSSELRMFYKRNGLKERIEEINANYGSWKICPLAEAAKQSNCDIAKILIDRGANIDGFDYKPLRYACFNNRRDMVLLLIENVVRVDNFDYSYAKNNPNLGNIIKAAEIASRYIHQNNKDQSDILAEMPKINKEDIDDVVNAIGRRASLIGISGELNDPKGKLQNIRNALEKHHRAISPEESKGATNTPEESVPSPSNAHTQQVSQPTSSHVVPPTQSHSSSLIK